MKNSYLVRIIAILSIFGICCLDSGYNVDGKYKDAEVSLHPGDNVGTIDSTATDAE